MRKFVSYVAVGMLICGVSFGKEPKVNIEEPIPYSASEKISDVTHERALKSLDKLTDKIKSNVNNWHRLNLGEEEYERRYGRNHLEDVEDENADENIGRTFSPFKAYREKYGKNKYIGSYEPTPNLIKNGGGRGLFDRSKKYFPLIEDNSYLK